MKPSPATLPIYSADRAKLPANKHVSSIEEARKAASNWDICGSRALDKRGGIEEVLERTGESDGSYNLERVLKECYNRAFYMPPSPSATQRSPSISKPVAAVAPPPLAI